MGRMTTTDRTAAQDKIVNLLAENLTQEQASDRAQIAASTISRWRKQDAAFDARCRQAQGKPLDVKALGTAAAAEITLDDLDEMTLGQLAKELTETSTAHAGLAALCRAKARAIGLQSAQRQAEHNEMMADRAAAKGEQPDTQINPMSNVVGTEAAVELLVEAKQNGKMSESDYSEWDIEPSFVEKMAAKQAEQNATNEQPNVVSEPDELELLIAEMLEAQAAGDTARHLELLTEIQYKQQQQREMVK